MSTLLTASICALVAGASSPAPAPAETAPPAAQPTPRAAPTLHLTMSGATTSGARVAPGATPSFRLRLDGDLPPAAGALRVGGVHTVPWEPASPPGAGALPDGGEEAGAQRASGPPPVTHQPRLVVDVAPGGSVDYRASLAAVFPEACRGGCETGTYTLWASVRPRDGAPDAHRRGLPLLARAQVTVEPVVVPAPRGSVRASLTAPVWETADTVRFVATLHNVGAAPVWVPRAARLAVGCHARVIAPDNTLLLDRHAVPDGAALPWTEREGARLAPGASVAVTLRCADLGTPPGSRVYLRARLRSIGAFVPRRERRAAYLGEAVVTREFRVR